MIVGPASRRPIRAPVDPRRAARHSNTALVCDAIWSRVFPTNTCVIAISPRSESPESWVTTLTTRDYPTRTWPKSAVNNGSPNHFTTRGKPRSIGVPGPFLCRSDLPTTPRLAHKMRTGLPRGARCGLLFRPRGRPPARHRRGRSPLNQPTRDHADGATLGRRDANASRRPRRPVMTGLCDVDSKRDRAVSVSVGDRTKPHRYTPSPAGRRRYKHRSALCSTPSRWR